MILRIFKVVAARNLLHNDLIGHYLLSSIIAVTLLFAVVLLFLQLRHDFFKHGYMQKQWMQR